MMAPLCIIESFLRAWFSARRRRFRCVYRVAHLRSLYMDKVATWVLEQRERQIAEHERALYEDLTPTEGR